MGQAGVAAGRGVRDRYRILFVDDDATILRMLAMIAQREPSWDPLFADGGQAALDLIESEPRIDVLFTDLHMPYVDGFAVLAAMKRRSPATIRIVFTGSIPTDASIDAGDVIAKPCRTARIRQAITRAIDGAAAYAA